MESSISTSETEFDTTGSHDSFGVYDNMQTGAGFNNDSAFLNDDSATEEKKVSEEEADSEQLDNSQVPNSPKKQKDYDDDNTAVKTVTENSVNPDLKNPDLYGKDWHEEPMVKLLKFIYCKQSVLNEVSALCSQPSHVVRRLIPRVFKPSGYLDATFTGQIGRASSSYKDKSNPPQVKMMNNTAKKEIIDYALKLATEKKWTARNGIAHTKKDLEKVMSQKIGELKRANALNNDSSLG